MCIFVPLFSDKTYKFVIGDLHRGANVFFLTVIGLYCDDLRLCNAVLSYCSLDRCVGD